MTLTVDAAVEGIIDYKEARFNDPAWWRRFRLLIEGLNRRKNYVVADAAYRLQLAKLLVPNLKEEALQETAQTLLERFYDIVGAVRPWEGRSYEARKRSEISDYRQQYEEAFGWDPTDPAFKEWEAERLEAGRKAQEAKRAKIGQNDQKLFEAQRKARERRKRR